MANDTRATFSYDRFFGLTAEAFQRFGDIFSLPFGDNPYEYLQKTYRASYPQGRVLDFGAGAQKPLQKVLAIGDDFYHSCDDDPSGAFTFSTLDDIPAEALYEIVAANQVFEHLGFDEGLRAAVSLAQHVTPGGIFQIGVPNPAHPNRYLSSPVHKTPWNYLNLYALLALSGLEPIYCGRANKKPAPRWFERPLVNMIARVYRMDWCDTVYAVGRRAE